MANLHPTGSDLKGASEQGKPSESYGNDTSPAAALPSQGGLGGAEQYDNDAVQAGSANAATDTENRDRPIVVIAFDPGITTGIATGVIRNGHMEVGSAQHKEDVDWLWHYLNLSCPDHIVYERFDYRRHKHRDGLELFSRELIGVIRLFAAIHNEVVPHVELYAQTPAEGVAGYYTDDTLKKEGLYKSGNPHANDAVRHLLQWYTFKAGYQFNTSGFSPC